MIEKKQTNKNYVCSTSYGTSVIHWNYTFPFFLTFFNLPVSFLLTVLILLQLLGYFFFPTVDEVVVIFFFLTSYHILPCKCSDINNSYIPKQAYKNP